MSSGRKNGVVRGVCICLMTFALLGTNASSKEWNGITPCISTRSDVVRILGKEMSVPDGINIYRFKDSGDENSRVTILYEKHNRANPAMDLVRKIEVNSLKPIALHRYSGNIPSFYQKFLKTELEDKPDQLYRAVYRNWDEGWEIWVQKNSRGVEVNRKMGLL